MTSRWVLGARPRTLPVAVVPVAVGTAAALGFGDGSGGVEPVIVWRAVAALVASLALQVATNFVNDYADGERGTDDTRVGPVRLVASGLATAREVKFAALAAFGVAGVAGGALAYAIGWELLAVGALSMLAGWAYTGGPKPYGYLGLGEVFVFVFFGLVATVGSFYVQVETVNLLAFLAAIPVGLLAVALLVINNLRDIPGDSASGKQTLAVRLGDHRTRQLYVGLLGAVAFGIVLCSIVRPPALVGLIGLLAARGPLQAVRQGSTGRDLIPVLGMTGKAQLFTGLLLAAGLVVGGLVD
ncbi:MAG: 1,4-dihydroxy-2-naphthoate polyprenyltransferase [Actinomycetota bacterium]|nr:1,4-dihydroxy-2-naphthoate polyprenyltransferase [Actinomycetota bacterium]